MKISNINNYKIIVITISLFSFLISVWQSTYVYDGHHWGLVASNAYDLLNHKVPYKEIFIQYGILTTLLHSIFMKIGSQSVISIFFFTSVIYSISIYYFFLIVKNKFENKLALFAVLCLVLIHPFVNHPWHNYLTFFFLILSLFYLEKNTDKYYFISGFLFGLSTLSYEKFLIVFLLFFICFALINLKNKKIKNVLILLIGFLIPLIIFFLYIYHYQIFTDWVKYQSIGDLYIGNDYIFVILSFLKNVFVKGVDRFIFEPYWLFFLILLILNVIFLCMFIFKNNFLKKKDEYLIYISIISISSFSSAVHVINSFRLVTGSIIGIFILIFFLNKIKNFETKKIISFSILIILCLGINFKKSENNKLYLTSVSSEYSKNNEIKFFKNLKFKKDTWKHTLFFNKKINEINQKCIDVNYAVNYTNNTYYYLLISDIFETFQIKPYINSKSTLDRKTMKLVNPNFESNLNEKIKKQQTLIITDLSFQVPQNYSYIKLPYSYDNKYKIILIPKKCINKI
tara:strand:- start:1072 stop:2610 length:1539 start_codon:yes stop_codon:yes gene_type:complete